MNPNPNKRIDENLREKGEKIGKLLGLEKVPLYNMAWKETRLQLPGGGECYPLIDVLERMAELITAKAKPKPRRGRKPKDVETV